MLLRAIGAGLPAALAIALGPFPVIGVTLILSGRSGRVNGPLFATGWIVGLSAVTALVVAVFGGADDPDSTSSAIADWGRVLVGAALIVVGVRKWRARPRPGDERTEPSWMTALGSAPPSKALVLGGLVGASPKHFVLAGSAATSMVEAGVHGADLVVAIALFVLVASVTVVGAVALRLFGGRWGASLLDNVREFMVANGAAITVVIMLILGAKVLGDGLIGLGR